MIKKLLRKLSLSTITKIGGVFGTLEEDQKLLDEMLELVEIVNFVKWAGEAHPNIIKEYKEKVGL